MTSAETTEVADRPTGPVTVIVNRKEVEVDGTRVSGLAVKRAAIEEGLAIELDFQLAMETRGGKQEVIGHLEVVEVTDRVVFFATACDDNS